MKSSCRFSIILTFLLGLTNLLSAFVYGQLVTPYQYDVDLLPASFHRQRRDSLRAQLPDSSIAIFFSNPIRNRSNDVDYVYHQDPNLYYFSGFRDPNAILVIFKEPFLWYSGSKVTEFLIIQPPNVKDELWTGRMATIEDAEKVSGCTTIIYSSDSSCLNLPYATFKKVLHLRLPQGVANNKNDHHELFDLLEQFKSFTAPDSVKTDDYLLQKIVARLRQLKSPEELQLLTKSIEMSVAAHLEMMQAVRPGMTEYEVEAVGEFGFYRRGAEDVGYPSICGSNENSCTLHYQKNRKTLHAGDLLLLDMGAEYHGYSADITRTLPVSGTFTVQQRTLYEIVLKAQEAGIRDCIAGNEFKNPHKSAFRIISEALLKLGIASDEDDVRRYFPHGTSHYLGLDVHDPGDYQPLQPGQVITVEPGIYIPAGSPCDPKWWNIGIRIEDDVLITDNLPVVLSGNLPKKTSEIEKIIQDAQQNSRGK